MIINVRGTNGSGKSTVVRTFLQRYPHTEKFGLLGPRRAEAYKVRVPGSWLYVVGPYYSVTGGIDALPLSAPEIVALLEKYRKLGHVIFEGVVISTYYGAVGQWIEQHKSDAKVVYLDTPLSLCLKGLAERGSVPRGTKNVEKKVKMVQRTQERFSAAGVCTVRLPRGVAYDTIRGWLR